MPARLFLILSLCVFCGNAYADKCLDRGMDAANEYADNVLYPYNALHGEDEWNSLSDSEKDAQKIRNLCMGTMSRLHMNCQRYRCMGEKNSANFFPMFLNRNLTGDEICDIIDNTNCQAGDVNQLKKTLYKVGGTLVDLFLFDMDTVISDIKSGNTDTSRIDANKEVCYSVDSNGDTVWHALLNSDKDAFSKWANLCMSLVGEQNESFLFSAAFFDENKSGQTAIQTAVAENKVEYFTVFGWYMEQEGVKCADIVEYANVSQSQISVICK